MTWIGSGDDDGEFTLVLLVKKIKYGLFVLVLVLFDDDDEGIEMKCMILKGFPYCV